MIKKLLHFSFIFLYLWDYVPVFSKKQILNLNYIELEGEKRYLQLNYN